MKHFFSFIIFLSIPFALVAVPGDKLFPVEPGAGAALNGKSDLCSLFERFRKESKTGYSSIIGKIVKENKNIKEFNCSLEIDGAVTKITKNNYRSALEVIYDEQASLAAAVAAAKGIMAAFEKCFPQYRFLSTGNNRYIITSKSKTGFVNRGYTLYIQTAGNPKKYAPVFFMPDDARDVEYFYINGPSRPSTLSSEIGKLFTSARTGFNDIKGTLLREDEFESVYNTRLRLSGTKKCELEDFLGALNYKAYYEVAAGSEQTARESYRKLIEEVKAALGETYMYYISKPKYTERLIFTPKADFSPYSVAIYVDLVQQLGKKYDVVLVVLSKSKE